jgi:pimeloyl-ACP methyl ester carboxylesterase
VTTTRQPEQISVPVDGGALAALRWPADRPGAPLVVLLHDLAASGRVWVPVADALAGEVELVAPDLRGRAGSAGVPGPYGLDAHAEDLAALVERLRPADHGPGDDVVLVGHAMGALVAELAADEPIRHRVRALVLVDGGLELPRPAGADLDTMIGAYLADAPDADGPTVDEALRVDGADLFENEQVLEATTDLPVPATLLWASRGPQGESPGLYDRQRLALLGAGPSGITPREVPGTDHWSILSDPDGVAAIAEAVRAAT